MMVRIVSHLFQIVVLARHAQTLLRIGHTAIPNRRIAQEKILELIHPRVGKHQGRIVLHNHRCRRNDLVALTAEKIKKSFSDLIRIHTLYCNIDAPMYVIHVRNCKIK